MVKKELSKDLEKEYVNIESIKRYPYDKENFDKMVSDILDVLDKIGDYEPNELIKKDMINGIYKYGSNDERMYQMQE